MNRDADAGLQALLGALAARDYRFTVPTNDTLRITRLKPRQGPATLADVFGWNRGFSAPELEPEILSLMDAAGVLARGWRLKSRIRVASVGEQLFAHSPWPPTGRDAVFLGPDSYRFARLIADEAPPTPPGLIVDVGTGAGVGALAAGALFPDARLAASDINPAALRLARINAAHAGRAIETALGSGLAGIAGPIDLALANPPFIAGRGGRTYRDGGGAFGAQVTLDWVDAVVPRLAPGGRLILYTGAAILGGRDPLGAALKTRAGAAGMTLSYREIDPDVFGGLLLRPDYWGVERIAAVGAVMACPPLRRPHP